VRRELLDHVVVFNERQLRRPMSEYLACYHDDRTHGALKKETPAGRLPVACQGANAPVLAPPRLGVCIIDTTGRHRDGRMGFGELPVGAAHATSPSCPSLRPHPGEHRRYAVRSEREPINMRVQKVSATARSTTTQSSSPETAQAKCPRRYWTLAGRSRMTRRNMSIAAV
jgi:hypothetical protein